MSMSLLINDIRDMHYFTHIFSETDASYGDYAYRHCNLVPTDGHPGLMKHMNCPLWSTSLPHRISSMQQNRMVLQLTQPIWSGTGLEPSLEPESSPGMQNSPGQPKVQICLHWFWSVCLRELRRCPPTSLEALQDTVNGFADSLDREDIIKSARDIIIRTKACKEAQGGAFEYKLKKFKRSLNREE